MLFPLWLNPGMASFERFEDALMANVAAFATIGQGAAVPAGARHASDRSSHDGPIAAKPEPFDHIFDHMDDEVRSPNPSPQLPTSGQQPQQQPMAPQFPFGMRGLGRCRTTPTYSGHLGHNALRGHRRPWYQHDDAAVHDAASAPAEHDGLRNDAPAATAAAATFTTAAAAAASTTSRVCASYDDSSGNAAHATQTCFIAAAAATACAYASGKVRSPVLHSHSPNIWGSIYTI